MSDMTLRPGDLCVVISTQYDSDADRRTGIVGKSVVIVSEDTSYGERQVPYAPFWHCSGLPSNIHGISHMALRKIPPAPMDVESIEEETMT